MTQRGREEVSTTCGSPGGFGVAGVKLIKSLSQCGEGRVAFRIISEPGREVYPVEVCSFVGWHPCVGDATDGANPGIKSQRAREPVADMVRRWAKRGCNVANYLVRAFS